MKCILEFDFGKSVGTLSNVSANEVIMLCPLFNLRAKLHPSVAKLIPQSGRPGVPYLKNVLLIFFRSVLSI